MWKGAKYLFGYRVVKMSFRYLLQVAVACLTWLCLSAAQAAPLLSEPKFSQLSTEDGLSQDTVNTLLIDSYGFLWIGTEGGLNRYDGYHVDNQILSYPVLQESGVLALLEDGQQRLWVSTANAGIQRLNLNTMALEQVGDWRFHEQPQWLQYASHMSQDAEDNIWLALNEQVVQIDQQTQQSNTLFTLPKTLREDEHMIRSMWVNQDIILIGTTAGLFAVDRQSGEQRLVDIHQRLRVAADSKNVKFLTVDSDNLLWIGTVKGLFSLPLAHLVDHLRDGKTLQPATTRIERLNIWSMIAVRQGQYFLGTDQGLFSFQSGNDQLQHVFRLTDSRFYLTDDDIRTLAQDKNGNLWLGSEYDGAFYWSPKSTRFNNIANRDEADFALSSNDIWTFHQQDAATLWIGTGDGLNRYDLDAGENAVYLMAQAFDDTFTDSTIESIFDGPDGDLWLFTGNGLRRFDTRKNSLVSPGLTGEVAGLVLGEYVWGSTLDETGFIWFVGERDIYRMRADSGEVEAVESISEQVNPALIDSLKAWDDNKILIRKTGELLEYSIREDQVRSLHALQKKGMQHIVSPDSVLVDKNGIMWIAYPGFGLFGLERSTLAQRYFFDRGNLLPTNSIYGLQADPQGNIWMSSHRGLLKFYPDNQHIQKFSYAEGLATLEYNQDAFATLWDGRMAYGSMKGLTLFDPERISEGGYGTFDVTLSSATLSGDRPLNLPLTDLSDSDIELQHDDLGLTLHFSTLEFAHQHNTLYEYRISGKENIEYPPSRDAQLTLPKLMPGKYAFQVLAFDPVTGQQSPPSSLNITVLHAPWKSPMAYTLYGIALTALLVFWWYYRSQQRHQILRAHADALESKNRLSMALTASNSNVWEWHQDKDGFYAPRMTEELGYTDRSNEVSFAEHLSLIHEQDKRLYESQWSNFIQNQAPGFDVTYRLKSASGRYFWYRDVGSAVPASQAQPHIVVAGTYSNITESLANREKVRLFGEAFKHTRDWVVIFDGDLMPVAANQAFCSAFDIDEQYSLDEQIREAFGIAGDHPPRFWQKLRELTATQHWKGEEQLTLHDGRMANVLVNMSCVASVRTLGEVDYYLMIMSDISEQKDAERELRRLANFDSLTNLPNRTLLLDRIKHAIDHAIRHKSTVGLFFIDLDRFKQVNDSLGHKAGDELLRIVAHRLTNLLRQDDTVARLGGDEFVVMVEEVRQPDKLSVLAQELIAVLEEPIQLDNQTVSVSSSIGIALFPGDANSSEELLRNADLAMYHAKEQGRNNFQYFTEQMNRQAQDRLAMENKVKKAQQAKQFVNYYQPIVNIDNGQVAGFELLMRWPTDEGMIPPDQFIPIAEELGLIEDMTWDALERAMPLVKEWHQNNPEVYLSVNLSARHFERQISIEQIIYLLQQYDLPVQVLRFEITESALMRDYEKAQEYMQSMQQHGFVIALDDFGTGYSSLKYLKEFPLQVLKVDKSFVDDIGKNQSNEAIILTTLRMAQSLNMYCVAEGIETAEQIAFFQQHDCAYLQGYYFSKPVDAEQTAALLARTWSL